MIKIKQKSNEKINLVTDISFSLANAIRRSVLSIPILAIEELEISKNDSALFDEIIAHRMGLVPLKNQNLELKENCSCKGEGCNKCTTKLRLSVKGPGFVYSDSLEPESSSIYKIPITFLEKNQELEFSATARMGMGIEHAKFSPGLFFYKYTEDENLEDIDEENKKFENLVESIKKGDKKDLEIFIESNGQISSGEIFIKAIECLIKDLKEFNKKIK